MAIYYMEKVLSDTVDKLEALIGMSAGSIVYPKDKRIPDAIVDIGMNRFVIEFKPTSLVAQVMAGITLLKEYPEEPSAVRLLVVPFMGETGMSKCRDAGVSWLDLSGNADVTAPGLRLYVRGEKNKFISVGRHENAFASKSSRVARRLLYFPHRSWTQRELSEDTGLGEGFVSRIVKTLEEQQLVTRVNGKLQVLNPDLLLEAWKQGYDFKKHEIIRGHVPGRTGEEIQAKVSKVLSEEGINHAATGLGAAWLYSKFAAFRTASFYLENWVHSNLLKEAGFRQNLQGANLWLILPKDPDVFYGLKTLADIPCVNQIQVWLDLHSHPERAEEAASELRGHLELQ